MLRRLKYFIYLAMACEPTRFPGLQKRRKEFDTFRLCCCFAGNQSVRFWLLLFACADNNTCPVCQCIAQGRKNSAYVFANGFLIFNLPFLLRSGQVLLFMARDMQCVATYWKDFFSFFFSLFFVDYLIFCGNIKKCFITLGECLKVALEYRKLY